MSLNQAAAFCLGEPVLRGILLTTIDIVGVHSKLSGYRRKFITGGKL